MKILEFKDLIEKKLGLYMDSKVEYSGNTFWISFITGKESLNNHVSGNVKLIDVSFSYSESEDDYLCSDISYYFSDYVESDLKTTLEETYNIISDYIDNSKSYKCFLKYIKA